MSKLFLPQILTATCCDIYKKSNRIPSEERLLLMVWCNQDQGERVWFFNCKISNSQSNRRYFN